jgi:hypothetical protein
VMSVPLLLTPVDQSGVHLGRATRMRGLTVQAGEMRSAADRLLGLLQLFLDSLDALPDFLDILPNGCDPIQIVQFLLFEFLHHEPAKISDGPIFHYQFFHPTFHPSR